MRIPSLLSALTLAAVLCTVPAAAQEQAQVPSQAPTQEPAAAVQAAPAEQPNAGQDLFLPEPEDKYGIIYGHCTVSVPCGGGVTVKCTGQTRCTWFYGNPGAPFVECDGVRTTCPLN
jgi:hypothetical protein